MLIIALEPLTADELQQIRDIMRKSKCPNESLHNTFDRYTAIHNDNIVFDKALDNGDDSDGVFIYKI